MIDTDKYEGHTPAPWEADLDDEGKRWIDAYDDEGDINLCRITNGNKADAQLIADAPLLLAEVKRLRERLMLAESALGEVRACHEDGQGNLGEILEHYRDKEGVEMPNAFDEVIE